MKTVSTTEANIALAQSVYAAYGRGDMAAMFDLMAPDIDWESIGPRKDYPLFGPRLGKAEAEGFFHLMPTLHQFSEFSPNEFLAGGDKVAVLGHYALTMNRSGRKMASDWVHVFTIKDGKVTRFREHTNTAKFVEAYRG